MDPAHVLVGVCPSPSSSPFPSFALSSFLHSLPSFPSFVPSLLLGSSHVNLTHGLGVSAAALSPWRHAHTGARPITIVKKGKTRRAQRPSLAGVIFVRQSHCFWNVSFQQHPEASAKITRIFHPHWSTLTSWLSARPSKPVIGQKYILLSQVRKCSQNTPV